MTGILHLTKASIRLDCKCSSSLMEFAMDAWNVVEYGTLVRHEDDGDVYELDGKLWKVCECYAPEMGTKYVAYPAQ